ncbi:PKD domain-containing protein, partial [Bacteroidia bacterium]|nr:PKD domain-containing protein [Bacteroidia bacterium]
IMLYDSSFKKGVMNHFWVINNSITVPISQASMEYELPNSFGDNVVIILRDTSTSNGCIAEKTFNVKNTAPGFKLAYGWSNTCQQSFFQGNMLTNPNKGLAPYTSTWTFSNGQTFNKKVLSSNFTDTGWVFIAMKIQDQNGCFALDTLKFYRPTNRIHVDFIGDKNGSTCTPMFVDFFDLSTSLGQRIVKWRWEFGDGGVSYFKNPRHQYLNPGIYDIRLTVTDDIGCTETRFFPKYLVLLGPNGDFTISDLVGCSPHKVYFKEKSNNPEASML